MRSMKNAMGILLLVSAIAVVTGCQGRSRQQSTSMTATVVPVHVTTVSTGNCPITVDAVGTISAQFATDLSSRAQERVTAITVSEGDRVRKGQPLVYLDTNDLAASEAQANADVQASTAQYGGASLAAKMASSTSVDQIQTAKAQVTEAQASLANAIAKRNLVDAGPRAQERAKAADDVDRSNASLVLAQKTYDRMAKLFTEDAITGLQLDTSKSALDAAQAAYQAAVQTQSMANEGSRAEEKAAAAADVDEAQAGLVAAKSVLAQAVAEAQVVNVRKADVLQAQAKIEQARAGLTVAQSNLNYATIVAPFDGVVVQRDADPGLMAGPGVPLLRLQGGNLRLDTSVPESGISSLRPGSSIPVSIDAIGTKQYIAKVISISPQGDSSTHTFMVKSLLPQIPGLREGMFGRASIPQGRSNRIMTIPANAVVNREGLSYVYIVAGDTAQLRLVTVGKQIGANVSVLSGLENGDKIATSNIDRLADNAQVLEVR
jgi:RND family efflux transporter MFP subunit